ncbi:MAG TPA: RNA methyltransferase [Pyrinomonadaceae bacterium]|nr:RNA methyltransferase [Pyrinomonadaceae bacterium]
MSALKISSRDNSLLRRARAVRDGKLDDLIFVEGLRLCEEALKSDLRIEAVIYSDHILRKDRAAHSIEKLSAVADTSATVSEKLLESVSYTKTPQGVVVLAVRPAHDEETFAAKQTKSPLVVILHEINNPVNVGAIVRTAEAAGATGVIATANTADPFSPKALRGAMGSAFRLPIWNGPSFPAAVAWCGSRKIQTIAADSSGSEVHRDVDWRKSSAIIVGRESTGLSPEELASTDASVRIPMQGAAESLNVAVATGVILFEAARQRAAN